MNPDTPCDQTPRSVLVVEDEADLQQLLQFNLQREGYAVTVCGSGEKAVQAATEHPPDLVLLDLMLPRMDGLDVCRRLKGSPATAHVPIVMVTAKGEDADVVAGLELGADDYITKPFSPRVLIARVKAVLRRTRKERAESKQPASLIALGPVEVDPDRHEARLDGRLLDLTATEFKLLKMIARRPGRVFTRQQIIEKLHGVNSVVTDRSVDVQIVSLRRKFGEHADLIETVRGVGYRARES